MHQPGEERSDDEGSQGVVGEIEHRRPRALAVDQRQAGRTDQVERQEDKREPD